MWQVTSGFFSSRARIVGFLIYAAVPVPYVAIAHGRFEVLVCFAALPWMLRLLVRIGERPVGIQKTQMMASTVLLGAVVMAFAPVFAIVALWAGASWMIADLVLRVRLRAVVAVAQLMVVMVIGAVVLNFPWSGGFFAADWWQQIVGVHATRVGHTGIATLARLDSGVLAISVAALGFYVPVIVGLLIVRGDKLVWAARSATLVVTTCAAIALIDAGYVDVGVPEYGVMFVVVACGLSLASATMASVVFDDQSEISYTWWKPLVGIAGACLVVACLPVLAQTADGRWGQPKVSLAQLVAQLPTNPESGDYNVVYVGRSEVLALPAMRLNDTTAFAVAPDGELTLRDHWLAPSNALTDATGQALSGSYPHRSLFED
jgi:hypothetical protein